MRLRTAFQVARAPVLLALLLVARPAQARLFPAMNTLDMEAARWPGLVLVAIPVVFVAVALTARRLRHPSWLLALEGVIAALLGLVLPLWGLWDLSAPLAWPPEALAPLAEALSHPMAVGAFGLGQAANWLVVVLALAWLVVVVDTAIRQARHHRAPREQPRPSTVRGE